MKKSKKKQHLKPMGLLGQPLCRNAGKPWIDAKKNDTSLKTGKKIQKTSNKHWLAGGGGPQKVDSSFNGAHSLEAGPQGCHLKKKGKKNHQFVVKQRAMGDNHYKPSNRAQLGRECW